MFIPPRFKHVATLPCEIRMQKNSIILKYVLQLMMGFFYMADVNNFLLVN